MPGCALSRQEQTDQCSALSWTEEHLDITWRSPLLGGGHVAPIIENLYEREFWGLVTYYFCQRRTCTSHLG